MRYLILVPIGNGDEFTVEDKAQLDVIAGKIRAIVSSKVRCCSGIYGKALKASWYLSKESNLGIWANSSWIENHLGTPSENLKIHRTLADLSVGFGLVVMVASVATIEQFLPYWVDSIDGEVENLPAIEVGQVILVDRDLVKVEVL